MLSDFFKKIETKHIGENYSLTNHVDNKELIEINKAIRNHPVEIIGTELRKSMTSMKKIDE